MKPLAQVCADWNLHDHMRQPERFLTRHIKAGHIPARKVGRSWFMTDSDIAAALEFFAVKPAPVVELVPSNGLSARSARRRVS